VESTKKIVDALRARDIFIHFMSSHFIFDGTKGNYTEEDKPTPILLYGKQKVEIERYLQETCDRYVILRLSKAVGDEPRDGTLFPNWIDGIIAGQRTIRCAADQIFSPIFTGDVCRGILAAMENDCRGIYNLSGFRAYSRMQLLELLLSQLEAYTSKPVNVVPCSINDFPLLEKRPLDVSMPPRKLVGATHLQIGSMEDVCLRTVERYFLKGVHQTPDKGAM
jgi:dTDP-4-dehydrorhamnose reductase